MMPFKSRAQRRKFAELLVKGEISPETYDGWNRETGRANLPERVTRAKATNKKSAHSKSRKATARSGPTRRSRHRLSHHPRYCWWRCCRHRRWSAAQERFQQAQQTRHPVSCFDDVLHQENLLLRIRGSEFEHVGQSCLHPLVGLSDGSVGVRHSMLPRIRQYG